MLLPKSLIEEPNLYDFEQFYKSHDFATNRMFIATNRTIQFAMIFLYQEVFFGKPLLFAGFKAHHSPAGKTSIWPDPPSSNSSLKRGIRPGGQAEAAEGNRNFLRLYKNILVVGPVQVPI